MSNDDDKFTNADVEFDARCMGYVEEFRKHGNHAESLYTDFKEIFDISLRKSKTSITISGGLRDIAEAAKSLSGIRGDAMTATTQGFNALMKIEDMKLKKTKVEADNEEGVSTALLMRQLTEVIHSGKPKGKEARDSKPSTTDIGDNRGEDQLMARFSADIGNKIRVNINEVSMKHDFNGVSYRYDNSKQTMVVLDSSGNKIDNYPIERIPDEYQYKRVSNGIPVDSLGREIKPYVGE